MVGLGADCFFQYRVNLSAQLGVRGCFFSHPFDDLFDDGVGARFARDGPDAPHRFGHADHLVIGSVLQKLIVAGVDNEQVGFVVDEFFGQHGHPIAGVADAAGIDHFPLPRWVGLRQHRPKPAAKRCQVGVGSAVGRRAADAKDAVRIRLFIEGELLRVEPDELVACRGHDALAVRPRLFGKERGIGRKPDVGVSFVRDGGHAKHHKQQFGQHKEDANHDRRKQQLLPNRQRHRGLGHPVFRFIFHSMTMPL